MGSVQRTRRGPWTTTTVVFVDMFASGAKSEAEAAGRARARRASVRPHRRAQSRARPRARLGLYDDSDVLPERGEQPAQPLDREALEPPPVQVREIWLRDSEAASCRPLRQAPSLNQLLNRVR